MCTVVSELADIIHSWYYLDGEVQHKAVRIFFRQFIKQTPPGGKLYHLLQPGWCLNAANNMDKKLMTLVTCLCASHRPDQQLTSPSVKIASAFFVSKCLRIISFRWFSTICWRSWMSTPKSMQVYLITAQQFNSSADFVLGNAGRYLQGSTTQQVGWRSGPLPGNCWITDPPPARANLLLWSSWKIVF